MSAEAGATGGSELCADREIAYEPRFLAAAQADEWLERLWAELEWRRESIVLFGRTVPQPRLTAWYGDPDAVYSYSGLRMTPRVWHPLLAELRRRLETRLECRFNSVLANAYRDGQDSMGWHADDEPELGPRPLIASLSLGEERRFCLRPRGGGPLHSLMLGNGSLLVMRGRSQEQYRHALPRTARAAGLRINLTYRLIKPRGPG